MTLFIPITKVDVEKRLVYGTLNEETPDKTGEIMDYESAKPAFQEWSETQRKASNGKSLGNVRAMHSSIAAGKLTDLTFDDENKRVEGCAKIVDDAEWQKVLEGVYTGFSIGGGYAKRWSDPKDEMGVMRYTPTLAEVSIVDNPCHPAATFDVIKADGSVEMRKFNQPINKEGHSMTKNSGGASDAATQAAADQTVAILNAAEEAVKAGTASDLQKDLIKRVNAGEKLGETEEMKNLMVKLAAASVALVKDGKPVKPMTAPVQKNVWLASDNSEHVSKRAAEIHNLQLETETSVASAMSKVNAALDKAKKATEEEDEDEEKEGDSDEVKKEKAARKAKKAEEAEAKKKDKTEVKKGIAAADMKDETDEDEEAESASGKKKAKKATDEDFSDPDSTQVGMSDGFAKPTATQTDAEEAGFDDPQDTPYRKDMEPAAKKAYVLKLLKANPALAIPAGILGDNDKVVEFIQKAKKTQKAADDEKDGKEKDGKYGDVEYADTKNKKYPIDTEEHVRAAWNYINKEKNAAKYDAEELKTIKSKIVAAWKAKVDKDGPPSAEKNKKAFMLNRAKVLAKGLDTVAGFAHRLNGFKYMIESCEMEAMREGDGSDIADKLKACLAAEIAVFLAMAEEETSELLDGDDEDVNMITPCVVMEMSAKLPRGSFEILSKSLLEDISAPLSKSVNSLEKKKADRLKLLADELAKAGARHSKADAENIQKMHKSAMDLHECMGKAMASHISDVAGCCKALGVEVEDDDKASGSNDMQDNKKMSKLINTLQAANDKSLALEKVLEKTNETLDKSADTIEKLLKTIEKQDARIDHLERQPAAPKGNVRSVSKAEDGLTDGVRKASTQQLDAALAKLAPEERAKVLMKAALANPQSSGSMR